MAHKRPLDDKAPEQEAAAARSPRKRLRRTVLVMMWLDRRRARGVTFEQMAQLVRQVQADMAKWFILIALLVARLASMERMVLGLQDTVQRLVTQQFAALQRSLIGSIEATVRSAVQTELQERQVALLPKGAHEPLRQISEDFPETGGITRMIKLCFVDASPKDPLYTGCPIQWQNGAKAKVAMFENERPITQGYLSKLQIEVLPVHADFFTERGQADFTKEEFNKQIYTYKGKESVLTTVNLANGEACLGPFFFTESSHRKKLCLAARVKRQDTTVRVQEAITYPFVVKDRRSELNEKSYPPSKEDRVHRLEKISPKGKRCHDLACKNITKVKHLLRCYHRDKSGLQKLTGMKKEDWSTMIKHATTSNPGDEIYSYRVAEENKELLFNDFFELIGTMIDSSYFPYNVDGLDQFQQVAITNSNIIFDDSKGFIKLKLNSWKASAHKKFEELENTGSLIPDYVMSNGCPVPVHPLINDTSPSIQARTWQCSNNLTEHREFGQVHPSRERNEFSLTQVFPNNDAGPSTKVTLPFQQYANEQTAEFGQQDPFTLQNGTSYHLTQGKIINAQGSFSGQSTILSHNIAPVQSDNLITGESLAQNNGYLCSLSTDSPAASYPVTDGVDHVDAVIFSELPPTEFQRCPEQNFEDLLNQFSNYEMANLDSQFHGYEDDDGNGGNFHCP